MEKILCILKAYLRLAGQKTHYFNVSYNYLMLFVTKVECRTGFTSCKVYNLRTKKGMKEFKEFLNIAVFLGNISEVQKTEIFEFLEIIELMGF